MAKFTVYVPDELWDRAKANGPDQNASQLVQDALRAYASGIAPKPAFARRPPDDAEAVVSHLVPRLADEAESAYQTGYREGLDYASESPWSELEHLAECNWSAREALRGADIDASPLVSFFRKRLPNSAEIEQIFGPTAVLPLWSGAQMTGFMDALRIVWARTRAFQTGESDAPARLVGGRAAGGETRKPISGSATQSTRAPSGRRRPR